MAFEKDLDLVKISPNAVPPVCKIMDYGKFRFEQVKKDKEARRTSGSWRSRKSGCLPTLTWPISTSS